MEVQQFKTVINQRGGGEEVMKAIAKTFKSKIFTFSKDVDMNNIEEIGKEMEQIITMIKALLKS